MRQQLVDTAVQVARQAREHVLEVGPRVVAVHPGGLHQAHDDSGTLAGEFAACEQPCLSSHRPGAHEIFNMVVVDGDVAIDQVGGQRRPALEAVVDGAGDGAAVGHAGV